MTKLPHVIAGQSLPSGSCCVCGVTDVTYRNYQQQPFCAACADGNSTTPHPSATPSAVARAFIDRIDRARDGQLHGWTVDDLPLYPTDASLPTLTVGIVRKLLAETEALTAEHDRRTHFGLFSHEGVDIVCTDCNRGPTSEEDRELFNLAEYDAWADQHKCEAKP